jgi:hypothetical protein
MPSIEALSYMSPGPNSRVVAYSANGLILGYIPFSAFGGSAPGGVVDYVRVADVKPNNTAGGSFLSGADRVRDINTIISDESSLCSLDNNQVTLAAGSWFCLIVCPCYVVYTNRARLYNVSLSEDLVVGPTCTSHEGCGNGPSVFGAFELLSESVLEIRHRCAVDNPGDGFGVAANFGEPEMYTVADFWRVSES